MNDLNKTQEYAKEIREWFASGKDFNEGYLLFVRFSHNRALAMQLARKGTALQSKLEYELQKIVERTLIIERPVMPIGVIKKAVAPVIEMKVVIATEAEKIEATVLKHGKYLVMHDEKVDYESLTDEQKALYDTNRDMYKEMRSYHEKMKLATTDEDRKAMRDKVVELDGLIRENWKQFDASFLPAVASTGSASDEEKETDPVKAVTNARSYLSKNLPKLETLTGKKLDELKAKVAERYQVLVDAGQALDETSIAKLKSCGIIVE